MKITTTKGELDIETLRVERVGGSTRYYLGDELVRQDENVLPDLGAIFRQGNIHTVEGASSVLEFLRQSFRHER